MVGLFNVPFKPTSGSLEDEISNLPSVLSEGFSHERPWNMLGLEKVVFQLLKAPEVVVFRLVSKVGDMRQLVEGFIAVFRNRASNEAVVVED